MINLVSENVCLNYKAPGIFSLSFLFVLFMYIIAFLLPFLVVYESQGFIYRI